MASPGTIAIIGAGSIGAGWALLFAAARHPCGCTTPPRRVATRRCARSRTERRIFTALICATRRPRSCGRASTTARDLGQAVLDADHVQECVPEDLELKRRLFAELDALAPAGCPIASSSSFMPASRLAADLPGRARCLVVHPGNPPFLLRVAEVVPAPFTAPETVERTEALLRGAGIAPIRVAREVEGFVFNRLQGAVLREAYCLVRDGVGDGRGHRPADARRARPALGDDRAVRDRRPQHARRHRGARRTHGTGLCADGGRAGPGRSMDTGAGRRGRPSSAGRPCRSPTGPSASPGATGC